MNVRAPAEPSTAIEAGGWTRRFTAIGARLSEAVDLYHALGYEVLLAAVAVGDDDVGESDEACAQCLVMTLARTIYTRRPTAADVTSNEEVAYKGPQNG